MEHQVIVIVDESVKENEITGAEMRGMKSVSNGASSSMPQDERKENDEARHWHDEAHQTNKARLGERRSRVRGNGRSSSICIFPLPRTIHTIKQSFQVPELVSIDFVEMMLLDGCFVVELLRLLGESGDSTVMS